MSSGKRYTDEFKIEAVKQVTEHDYSVAEVAERLGTTTHSLYAWIKRYGEQSPLQIINWYLKIMSIVPSNKPTY